MSLTKTPWNLERIEEMRKTGVEESLVLDYKAAGALDRSNPKTPIELSKDVSAFANSAGGILIYGVGEDPANKHLPGNLDPILRSSVSKEWLESIILNIQPKIEGLEIHPVSIDDKHALYVIDVPKSTTAHQARDHRYYKRWNFSAQPMEDYEIRDVMNRKVHPRVIVEAKFTVFREFTKNGEAGELFVKVTNDSDILARHVSLIIHSPIRVRDKLIAYNKGDVMDVPDGRASKLLYSNRNDAPLFPRGMLHKFFLFKFATSINKEPEKPLNDFRWLVFADSMPRQSGSFTVEEIYCKGD